MPAVAIGAVSVWSGVGAWGAAAAWSGAAWAAGATIVGGAAMAYGGATGNKKLAEKGMIVAGIGGLATAAGNAGMLGENFAGQAGEITMGGKALPGGVVDGASPFGDAGTSSSRMAGTGAEGVVPQAPMSGVSKEMLAMQKYSDINAAMMKQNMIAQTVGGVGQAYSGWQGAKTQKEIEDARLAEQTRLTERDYANRNNIVGLKIPRIGIKRPGLINSGGI